MFRKHVVRLGILALLLLVPLLTLDGLRASEQLRRQMRRPQAVAEKAPAHEAVRAHPAPGAEPRPHPSAVSSRPAESRSWLPPLGDLARPTPPGHVPPAQVPQREAYRTVRERGDFEPDSVAPRAQPDASSAAHDPAAFHSACRSKGRPRLAVQIDRDPGAATERFAEGFVQAFLESPCRVIDANAPAGHADVVIDVRVTRAPTTAYGYRFKASATEVSTGRILAVVVSEDGGVAPTRRRVAVENGWETRYERPPFEEVSRAFAGELMARLARTWS